VRNNEDNTYVVYKILICDNTNVMNEAVEILLNRRMLPPVMTYAGGFRQGESKQYG
jgi:hypothetical protein